MEHKAKFCPNCGKSLKNEPEFCPFCGYNLQKYWKAYDQAVEKNETTDVNPGERELKDTSKKRPSRKHKRNRFIIIITAIAVLVAVLIFFICRSVNNENDNTSSQANNSLQSGKAKKKESHTKTVDSSNSSTAVSSSAAESNQFSATTLTPNQTAAAIAYYADEKGYWQFNFTPENYLETFEETTPDNYDLSVPGDDNVQYEIRMAGTGSGGSSIYTLNGGTEVNIYSISDDGINSSNSYTALTTVSLSNIVKYINDNNSVGDVNTIAKYSTIEDDR